MADHGNPLSDKALWAYWEKPLGRLHTQLTEDMIAVARRLGVAMDDVARAGGSPVPPAKRRDLDSTGPLFELQSSYWQLATASLTLSRRVGRSTLRAPDVVAALTAAHQHIRAAEGHVDNAVTAEADVVKMGMAALAQRRHSASKQALEMATAHWWPSRNNAEYKSWKVVGILVSEWLHDQGFALEPDTVQRHLSKYGRANGFEGYSRRKP